MPARWPFWPVTRSLRPLGHRKHCRWVHKQPAIPKAVRLGSNKHYRFRRTSKSPRISADIHWCSPISHLLIPYSRGHAEPTQYSNYSKVVVIAWVGYIPQTYCIHTVLKCFQSMKRQNKYLGGRSVRKVPLSLPAQKLGVSLVVVQRHVGRKPRRSNIQGTYCTPARPMTLLIAVNGSRLELRSLFGETLAYGWKVINSLWSSYHCAPLTPGLQSLLKWGPGVGEAAPA